MHLPLAIPRLLLAYYSIGCNVLRHWYQADITFLRVEAWDVPCSTFYVLMAAAVHRRGTWSLWACLFGTYKLRRLRRTLRRVPFLPPCGPATDAAACTPLPPLWEATVAALPRFHRVSEQGCCEARFDRLESSTDSQLAQEPGHLGICMQLKNFQTAVHLHVT